jgi:adenine-specific DNA glycosylase
MTWRDKAKPIIYRVIAEHKGEPEKEIRRALRDAYPWGERAYHPYRIWCSEVNRQMADVRPVDKSVAGLPLFESTSREE